MSDNHDSPLDPVKIKQFQDFMQVVGQKPVSGTETVAYPAPQTTGSDVSIGYWNPIMGGQCPNCGYCPHCGRSGHYHPPYWPHQPQITYCKA
jgi:hypothetical protein